MIAKGRPKKDRFINFAVTRDDLQRLNKILSKREITASEYMRRLLHKAFQEEGV